MSDLVINVANISKAYRIGLKEKRHDTLGAAMAAWVKSPFKNFKRLKSLSNFNNHDDADIFWALKGINFEVKKGEVLGIIGKNGAGKSTLLKILSRITEPTDGRIEIYGRVASLLEVGTGFNPELTGRENIYLNGTILGMTKKEIDERIDEIIDFSGIEKFINTPVKRYSSGMKVRLAFAVAAHLESEILIVDEVLAVGDIEFQKKCLSKMDSISNSGRTVLFVSHDIGAVSNLCTSAILLSKGRLIKNDSVSSVIDDYLNNMKLDSSFDDMERQGTGRIRFKKISFFNQSGVSVQPHIKTGDGIEIRIEYEINDPAVLREPYIYFYIFIKNKRGVSLVQVSNKYTKQDVKVTGTVGCRLDNIPLAPDDYTIRILCKSFEKIEDLIENACSFKVSGSDGWGGYKMYPSTTGGNILVENNWFV